MDKNLLQQLEELNLPESEYAIFGGGQMAVRGIRESDDLDLIVSEGIFEEFKNKDGWNFVEGRNDLIFKDKIEMGKNWIPGEWDAEKLIKEAEIIDGFPYARMGEVLKWKKLRGKEKDLKDIRLIENYLKNK